MSSFSIFLGSFSAEAFQLQVKLAETDTEPLLHLLDADHLCLTGPGGDNSGQVGVVRWSGLQVWSSGSGNEGYVVWASLTDANWEKFSIDNDPGAH